MCYDKPADYIMVAFDIDLWRWKQIVYNLKTVGQILIQFRMVKYLSRFYINVTKLGIFHLQLKLTTACTFVRPWGPIFKKS